MRIYTYIEFQWNEKLQTYKKVYAEYEEYEGKVALCGSGGGGGGDQKTEIRYAPYIESKHANFLATVAANRNAIIGTVTILSFKEWRLKFHPSPLDAMIGIVVTYEHLLPEYEVYKAAQRAIGGVESPFADYVDIEVDSAFFGAGYLISSFPSLYSIFGKYMSGLDIEVLWSQTFEDTVNSPVVHTLIAAQSAMMDDDIEMNVLPRLQTGMRDLNSVMSSSYVIGKAIIEDARVKALNLSSADLRYRLIPVAESRWQTHLEWNKGVVGVYAEMLKFYFAAKTDVDEINYAMAAKNKLWPFTVLDFERAALGALQGAMNSKTDVAGASTTAKVLSGALSGAAMGAMVGGSITQTAATTSASGVVTAGTSYAGWGAGIGAALGIAAALTY